MYNRWQAYQAAMIIRRGGVIAYPTETVYGLGCSPLQAQALQRIVQIKKRSPQKGLILISHRSELLHRFMGYLSPQQYQQLNTLQTRATTWLVPAAAGISPLLTGGHKTVAVRLSQHPLIQLLSEYLQSPIISTSANISGHDVCRSPLQIKLMFKQQLDKIIYGTVAADALPSRIIDIRSGNIIRA